MYNTLQRTATHCKTMHWYLVGMADPYATAGNTNCHALQHTTTPCTALHRTATLHRCLVADPYATVGITLCNALQRTATHCNALHRVRVGMADPYATVGNTLCNALQCIATHCNTLQHTAPASCGYG